MFTFEQIKELIELVGRNKLHALEVERSGFKLRITGEAPPGAGRETVVVTAPSTAAPLVAAAAPAPAVAPAAEAAPAGAEPGPTGPAPGLHVVVSPIVGTFYAAPSPDAPAYARVGDRVRKGQVLCIVEAMKLMNEIESCVDGVVAEIYPKNAQPIEYGEPLFGVRPD
jgi:acetyl-CoA carboxylase biotin carboxyl carrier protein